MSSDPLSTSSDSLSTSMLSQSEQSDDEKSDDRSDDVPAYLQKERMKPSWLMVPQLLRREMGSSVDFYQKCYSSVHMVERLDIMTQLRGHQGAVNALNFNPTGNLLASGSDDLHVRIWNWATEKSQYLYSGHKSNVLQTKWLPFVQDMIATCDCNGEVRLLNLESGISEMKAHHHFPTHTLAVHPDTPDVILSVGEDARILSIDIRERKPKKLCRVRNGGHKVALYSVHSNPLQSHEFCVSGHSPIVRIYDRRHMSKPVHELCPKALRQTSNTVTSAVYNYNGSEVLASYTAESIYLFDAVAPKEDEYLHKYSGQRNVATIKGVNFLGLKSEYIISGSDCSTIFVWEKSTEAVVQSMKGDSTGAVNCLEQHPLVPVLATSGLDYDVKIWTPSRNGSLVLKNLAYPIPPSSKIGTQGRPLYDRILFGVFSVNEELSDSDSWFEDNVDDYLNSRLENRLYSAHYEVTDDSDDSDDDDTDDNDDDYGLITQHDIVHRY